VRSAFGTLAVKMKHEKTGEMEDKTFTLRSWM